MPYPVTTYESEGNIRASSSLAAGGSASYDIDARGVLQLQLTVLNTPGSSVSSTRGVRVDLYNMYGETPSVPPTANPSMTLPSQTASTAESLSLWLGTGWWRVKITNLDATYAVTVEITSATIDGLE